MVEYEPFSPEWRDDPYPKYRELRRDAPVHYAPEADAYCVSRYADVVAVLKDSERFSSHAMLVNLLQRGRTEPPPFFPALRFVGRLMWRARMHPRRFIESRNLIAEDGESHLELRNIVNRGFTPRRIASLEARIRELSAERVAALDGLAPGARFDLMRDVAIPLPVAIISEILGIERERYGDFKRWSDTIISGISTQEGRDEALNSELTDAFVEIVEYVRRIAHARRKAPTDDLISTIVTGTTSLDDYEVVHFVILLLIAGNETTTNLIGNTVSALLDHPEQLALLAAQPELVSQALEETLRFDAPIQLVFRNTTEAVEVAGVRIPVGATVIPLLGSANRDETQFPDPDRFDLRRAAQGHVGFGFGKHFCLGSSLARLEARCALEALLPLLPKLARATHEREFVNSFLVRGPRRLELARAA